jgi:hypothetical protein
MNDQPAIPKIASPDKTCPITIFVLALFPLLLYMNTLGNSFQYDDLHLIVGNAYVQELRGIWRFFVSPSLISDTALSGYRPLTMTTFTLNYAVGGSNPFGYHLLNVIIHAASVLLVFGSARVFMRAFDIGRGYSAAPAVIAALLFAAHPINSQPANYISGRSTLLVGCFSLACFFLYARSLEVEQGDRDRRRLLLAGSLVAYLLALLSKEEAVAVPGLLAAYEICRLRFRLDKDSIRRIATSLAPFVLLTLGFMFFVIRVLGIIGDTGQARGTGENLLTQAKVLFIYLKMMAIPTGLSIDHVVPTITSPFTPVALLCILGVVALLCGSFLLIRKSPVITFGIWWTFGVLAPTSTLIALKLALNEQRLYLVVAGLSLVVGAGFGFALDATEDKGKPRLGRALILCAVVIIAIFSTLTIRRNTQWRTPMSLWMSVLELYPGSMRANAAVANELLKTDRPNLALPHARMAVEAGPDVYETRLVLAKTNNRLGLLTEALAQARIAADINPESSEVHNTLGTIYAGLERWNEAEASWERALELKPGNFDAIENLRKLRAMD